MNFRRIDTDQAQQLIASKEVQVIDIRDKTAFEQGHITDAFHVNNANVQEYIQQADLEKPLIVCCYHGHTSQGAAAFFVEQGFEDVYSLDGGFEAWATSNQVNPL